MEPRIVLLPETKLAGKHLTMSLSNNRTGELWKSFMPRRKEIGNRVSSHLFSMQVYNSSYNFSTFNPAAPFEKWAAVEVSDFSNIPPDMETCILPEGRYAVFLHKGAALTGPRTFGYIFGTWLPSSGFVLDHRPHFELLGEKYKNDDPDSEEEIWIPVKPKI